MDTIEITLSVPILEHDRYIALLDERATGFLQNETTLTAYVPNSDWSASAQEELRARLEADGYGNALSTQHLKDRNWNAVWEESVAPVRVGPFLLCGTTTEVPPEHEDADVLQLDPKMSFGTGHHATTRLALQLLVRSVDTSDRVLDIGTGTGILAIAACRLGAQSVHAYDTDPQAVTNARENVAQNDAGSCVSVREGSIDDAPTAPAEVIVANITRDILIDLLPAFRSRLPADGDLILSGLLTSDRSQMADALEANGLQMESEVHENGWWAVCATPQPNGSG